MGVNGILVFFMVNIFTASQGVWVSQSGNPAVECNSSTPSKCCYHFTWPGDSSIGVLAEQLQSLGVTAGNTSLGVDCKNIMSLQDGSKAPCYDPIVFTNNTNPPDMAYLSKMASQSIPKWPIYCDTQDFCMTYTFSLSSGAVKNETRFCGHMTDTNTGALITNGCYKQYIDSTVITACVCDPTLPSNHACNS